MLPPQKELSYGPVEIAVPANTREQRLDLYLHARFQSYSRSRLQTLIRQGAVTLDGRPAKPSAKVSPNAVIRIELPEDDHRKIQPEAIPLDVLYEDEHLVVVNKPAGMVVHPARGNWSGTLVNALVHHCAELSATDDPARPGVVHRLDRDTSGVIIAAKTDEAYYKLGEQFACRTTRKEYLAITDGEPGADSGEMDFPLGPDPKDRLKIAVRLLGGKRAITHYKVQERFGGYALVLLQPRTGRTHQIRVHLQASGCPVLADPLYSDRSELRPQDLGLPEGEPLLSRQALHALRLTLNHPASGEPMTFEAPLPADMERALAALRACRQSRDR
jgi:23S rRNA pseudouridine1911/1915/1917 synthase